jgi:glycosyltransferase involved in cell wall biosynthesis
MLPPVSVVITCHNLERYIDAAIRSVLAQSWDGPVELIVVDDASTDGSRDLIARHPTTRTIASERNVGVLGATVLGLRACSHDIVFFLDGDDEWTPDKLQQCVPAFAADPRLGLLTHDLEYIDAEGVASGRATRPAEVLGRIAGSTNDAVRESILLHTDYVWLGSAYAIRRSVVDAEGFCQWALGLPDPFNVYQDWPLAFWAACRPDCRMTYVNAKLLRYRVHAANHSGDSRSVDTALRNFNRSRNTMDAIESLAARSRLEARFLDATRRKAAFYAYLSDLYSGRRLASLKGFIRSWPYIARSHERPPVELARFVGIELLGVRNFTRVVAGTKAAAARGVRRG